MSTWPIKFPPQLMAGVLAVFLVVFVPITVWATFFKTTPQEAVIGQMRWERQVEVEKFKTIQDKDWEGHEPDDARVYDRRREVHHHERVLSHYETKSESYSCGTYQDPRTCYRTVSKPVYRYDPVYRWRSYYEVDRWVTERWLVTKGTEIAPHWATAPSTFTNVAVLGNERVGDELRQEYEADVLCDVCDEGSVVQLDWSEWPLYHPSQKVTAYVNSRGTVRGVEP